MSNYRIKIQYDGSRYRGWQRQQGEKNTIQGRIEQVLSKQMGFPVTIDGAGRTDAGVHAKEQVANFRLNTEKTTQQLQDVLNEYLPEDIRAVLRKMYSDISGDVTEPIEEENRREKRRVSDSTAVSMQPEKYMNTAFAKRTDLMYLAESTCGRWTKNWMSCG